MDVSQLKRDPDRVKQILKVNGQQVIAMAPCKLQIPERFVEQGLAHIGAETHVLGFYALIVEDQYYAVSLTCTMLHITPSNTNMVKIGEDSYREFVFDKGDVVIHNHNVVKNDNIPFDVYQEFFAKGRIPWFMNYEDVASTYSNSPKYSGVRVGANPAVVELMTAAICRGRQNRTQYYRHVVTEKTDLVTNPPVAIPLKDVSLGATNTTAKLMGAYFEDGLTSALVNPSDRAEPIENLLRQ